MQYCVSCGSVDPLRIDIWYLIHDLEQLVFLFHVHANFELLILARKLLHFLGVFDVRIGFKIDQKSFNFDIVVFLARKLL